MVIDSWVLYWCLSSCPNFASKLPTVLPDFAQMGASSHFINRLYDSKYENGRRLDIARWTIKLCALTLTAMNHQAHI